MVKVLIIDDSVMFRTMLTNELQKDPMIQVIGTAGDAYEAKDKILQLKPDVLSLDVEMPKMNGIEFLKKLLPQYPIAAVVVTSSPVSAFEAISAGAVDFIKKPTRADMSTFIEDLRSMIKTAATAKVVAKTAPSIQGATMPSANIFASKVFDPIKNAKTVVAIGASTGGTEAILEVIKDFPASTPGTIIVQHMPAGFTKMYAERLNRICKMEVREAKNGDRIKQGLILLGAGNYHLRLKKDAAGYYVSSTTGEKVSGHCPSVDVMFDSVAEIAGNNAIGVILTGMGADGADGLLKLRQTGAFTVGQDKETCIVYGMPMVAFNKGAVAQQAPLQNISGIVLSKLK
ncbi:MAG: chemotaxis response regulator protein-glutamate methylesterase [Oscillospiraceae bacterium]|jgi:two-component system chemotaxis response regulator CheB|nr:chemotaxis response regulator protein-glutamate methylesterase [Oscillospiraceae bacterium]